MIKKFILKTDPFPDLDQKFD